MKYSLSLILFAVSVLVLSGCKNGGGEDPTPAELQTARLAGEYKTANNKTWSVSSVLFNGVEDRTSDWTGFTLTIAADPDGANSYSTTNAFSPGPWPSSGTWVFGGTVDNPNINKIIRDSTPNELDIAITVSDSELIMTFTYDDQVHNGGRIEVVNGEYSFTFTN